MSKALYIFFLLFVIGIFSVAYAQNTDKEILKEYQRIEHLKNLKKDSVIQIRGEDFNLGSTADEKRYRIYREKERIVKMEYEEINIGYRLWKRTTTLYLKNDIPIFILEKKDAVITYNRESGEESKPYKQSEEIYVYDWKNEKSKTLSYGKVMIPQYRICSMCYDKLISEVKNAVALE
ncbi:hypothetical protein ASG01_11000 [Chryseobacterium sp. Leaf180]|uniref:hypothetical protein n=1 Tax=Chryseobacterium sp. Leaf180 TaxID=1736289 RepID=UPI0006FB5A0F|nr:hypothetical protein [Chryseobacterium sp. Leaf180]KQR92442.1 hypothetical protein ASG01_11000 [Chryseobacterium sp. Leaf180]